MPPSDIPNLATPRFNCRAPVEGDVDAFWPAFSSEAHMRYWSRAAFTERDALADYLLDIKVGRSWVAVPHDGGAPVFRMFAGARGEGVS